MNIRWGVLVGVAALVMGVTGGCAVGPRGAHQGDTGSRGPGSAPSSGGAQGADGASQGAGAAGAAGSQAEVAQSVEAYAAAIKANARRTDHESDSRIRADLAARSTRDADACLTLDPRAAACQYSKAVATGLEARVHPTRAVGLLGNMLENLGNADATDPNYDNGGPSRVRALVLIRAPGWPIGPGDADAGLVAARKAVSLQPDFPPNVLALAEALSKTGDEKGARENYTRARDLAQASLAAPERDDWLRDAEEGLRHK